MSSNEWRLTKWGDLATLEYGKSLRDYESKLAETVPVYGTNGLIGYTDKPLCPFPSVIIGRKGAYRGVHYSNKPFFVIDTAFYLKPKTGEIDLLFAYYQLLTQDINSMDSGSAIPSTSREDFYNLEINLPPLPTQHRIADILSVVDEKIELNRQTNATLEAIAQSIFREWFVDNEDVVNWEVAPLSKIINLNLTRSLKKGSIAPYLDMANMPTQGHRAIEWRDRPFGSGTKFMNGDTLLARITPCLENGKTAFVDFLEDGQVGWGSTEYIVFSPKPPLPPEYGYYLARTEEVRTHAIQNMIGTSGRQRASASCFDSFMISVPPTELAARFGDVAKSLMAEIKANDEESRILASIRDALLPKLMSGEIEV